MVSFRHFRSAYAGENTDHVPTGKVIGDFSKYRAILHAVVGQVSIGDVIDVTVQAQVSTLSDPFMLGKFLALADGVVTNDSSKTIVMGGAENIDEYRHHVPFNLAVKHLVITPMANAVISLVVYGVYTKKFVNFTVNVGYGTMSGIVWKP